MIEKVEIASDARVRQTPPVATVRSKEFFSGNPLWQKIELEAYCVRGTVDCTILSGNAKVVVLASAAKKLRELAGEVEKLRFEGQ